MFVDDKITEVAQEYLYASNQRFAQTHHLLPEINPGKLNSFDGVIRSFPIVN